MRRVPLAERPLNLPWMLKVPESKSPVVMSVWLKVLFFLIETVSSMLTCECWVASPVPPSVG